MTWRIRVPDFGLVVDKLVHERLALVVLEHDDLDTSCPEVRLAADKRRVLANHDALYLVQDARSRAHVARRERRVHGRARVCCGGQSA